MSTKTNVTAAKPKVGGSIYIADTTASMPTDATTTLGSGWSALGYLAEGGVNNDSNISTSSIKAFGGDEVLVTYTGREDIFKFALIEALNVDVLKAVYGASNVTGTLATGITINVTSDAIPSKAFCFEFILRDGTLKRVVVPEAYVTAVGTITYGTTDAVSYDTTIKATADANGVYHKEYISQASNG